MRSAISTAGLALAAVLLVLAAAPAAQAQDLDAAKAKGLVGERLDGLVGQVDPDAPPEVKQLVQDVNARRKQKYAEIAAQNGTAVDAVAALAGRKLIERAPPGQFVMNAQGHWEKKK